MWSRPGARAQGDVVGVEAEFPGIDSCRSNRRRRSSSRETARDATSRTAHSGGDASLKASTVPASRHSSTAGLRRR